MQQDGERVQPRTTSQGASLVFTEDATTTQLTAAHGDTVGELTGGNSEHLRYDWWSVRRVKHCFTHRC